MKVTHCCVYYAKDYKGGIQSYVASVVKEQKKKIDVGVLTTSSFADGDYTSGVKRVKSYGIFFRTPFAPAYLHTLKNMDSDVFHFHSPNPLMDYSALASARKYVVSVHNTLPPATAGSYVFVKLAEKLLMKNLLTAGAVVVYNKKLLDVVIPKRKVLKQVLDKTVEIPPGIDRTRFRNMHVKRSNDVLFVAHVRPEKGLHVLVDAFRHLKTADARLVVMAKASYFADYLEREIRKARKMLGSRLVVVMNPSNEQIAGGYATCGCVACPSLTLESWNFVVMEAAACGAPIVRSDLEAMNWLREPYCAVARVGDPLDLAEKIDAAFGDKERLGRHAEREVGKYSWDKTAENLMRVYSGVMG
jgi:glycosyltransferase involved in cell wall biosynthesis